MTPLNEFGSEWTVVKLDILKKYLSFYTQALSKQNFSLIYIDGFAGTGECTVKLNGSKVTVPGSAQIALETKPPFKHLIFIEEDKAKVGELETLCEKRNAICDSIVFHGDANKQVKRVCGHLDKRSMRAVAFVDPFGMEVNWETLTSLAATECTDMIFLFSLSGLYRQAERNVKEDFDSKKAACLDRFLGTNEWRGVFYEPNRQGSLLGEPQGYRRIMDYKAMLDFAKKRMEGVFQYVSDPLLLPQKGPPQFALFLAVSNPSPKAAALARRVYKDITNKHR